MVACRILLEALNSFAGRIVSERRNLTLFLEQTLKGECFSWQQQVKGE